jgi:Phage Tail Collar Domain
MRLLSVRLSYAILIFTSILLSHQSWSQVAIGTSGNPTPNSKAVLLLVGNNSQGLIIPIVSNKNAVSAGGSEKGMVVFDDSDKNIYYYNGTAWVSVGGGSGSQGIQINGNTVSLNSTAGSTFGLASPAPSGAGQLLAWNGTAWEPTPTPTITGQTLSWNQTTGKWTVASAAAVTTLSGDVTGPVANTTIANTAGNSIISAINNAATTNKILPTQLTAGTANQVLTTNASGVPTWTTGGAGGETNTASNVGTGGTGTFKQKTGVNLEFKNINAASNRIAVTNDVTNNEVDIDVNQANLGIATTQLTGQIVQAQIANGAVGLLQLATGPPGNVLTTDSGGVPTWTTGGTGGETNTASNVGTGGIGTFKQKTGVNLEFKNINAASNRIAVTNDVANNEVDIDVNPSNLTLSGDISGNLTSATVTALQNRAVLNQAPANGQVLKWNNALSQWEPGPDNVGSGASVPLNSGEIMAGVSGINTAVTVGLDASLNSSNGNITVQGLRGRSISSAVPPNNSVYQYDGTQWAPVVLSGISNPMIAPNDMIVGGTAGAASRLIAPTNNQLLSSNGSGALTWIPQTNFVAGGTQLANRVLASPNGSVGLPTYRQLVDADITGPIAGSKINPDFGIQPILGSSIEVATTKFNGIGYNWPNSLPASNRILQSDNLGNLTWVAGGSGFSTNNTIPKGDGTVLVASSITDNGTTVEITANSPNLNLKSTSGVSTGAASSLEFTNAINGLIGSIADTGSSDHLQISSFVQGLLFNTNFATRMAIDNSGNVGIGTISPISKLDVSGDVRLAPITAPGVTAEKLYNVGGSLFWNGTNISSGGSGWSFVGNPSRVDGAPGVGTNYIGTTDNVPLNFMVNNQRSGRIDPAQFSTFFGFSSGQNNGNVSNTGFGNFALAQNTSGAGNTAMGASALSGTTTGIDNTAVGNGALFFNSIGNSNAAFGNAALSNSSNASGNTAIGAGSLQFTTTGNGNTAVGRTSLSANTTGGANTAVGSRALFNNTASNNTAMGNDALFTNTSAGDNAAFGVLSLSANTGAQNTGLGAYSLQSNTTGADNAGVGNSVLLLNTTGSQNTAVGSLAGRTTTAANANTSGSGNTFIGYASGPSTPTQLTNATAIGASALVSSNNTIQLGNAAVTTVNVGTGTTAKLVAGQLQITGGTLAANRVLTSDAAGNATWQPAGGTSLLSNTGTNNLFAGNAFSTSGTDNAIFGANAGTTNTGNFNVFIGAQAANTKTTGDLNTIIGWFAGKAANNAGNTFVGAQAGENTTGGVNTFIGEKAGQANTTGNQGVFIGNRAGDTNVGGDGHTIIGNNADVGSASLSNATAIGFRAQVNQSNSLVLGSINGVNGAISSTNVGIGTNTPAATLDIQATDAMIIPDGTNAQRPAATVGAGAIRYNTDLGMLEFSDGTTWHSLVPPGTIVAYGGATAPAGWLICDGTTYNNTTYPKLFAAIGTAYGAPTGTQFRVPDFRGKFLRGVDGTASFDPNAATRIAQYTGGNGGNAVGSLQSDAMQGHSHQIDIPYSTTSPGSNQRIGATTSTAGSTNWNASAMVTDGTNGTPRTSGETRPVNIYVNYIIKF